MTELSTSTALMDVYSEEGRLGSGHEESLSSASESIQDMGKTDDHVARNCPRNIIRISTQTKRPMKSSSRCPKVCDLP